MEGNDLWLRYLQREEARKAHLNGANNSNFEELSRFAANSPKPPVWGGWGQQKPRIRLPPALGRMGFLFTPPPPPPPDERERQAQEFTRIVSGTRGVSGEG